jgi:hypothetical protein
VLGVSLTNRLGPIMAGNISFAIGVSTLGIMVPQAS